jgi:hypothetical protein
MVLTLRSGGYYSKTTYVTGYSMAIMGILPAVLDATHAVSWGTGDPRYVLSMIISMITYVTVYEVTVTFLLGKISD